jgi:hypothetical protein
VDPESIAALERELPDPVDVDCDEGLLVARGVTPDRLSDHMGGSP